MRNVSNCWLLTFVVAFGQGGCGKTAGVDSPNSGASPTSVPFPPAGATQSAAIPTKTADRLPVSAETDMVRFAGEVARGQQFERAIATGLVFRLEPDAGDDSGWSMRLAPQGERSPASIDCIGSVSEPLHGSNQLEIDPTGAMMVNGHAHWLPNSREFYFVGNPADCKSAWDLANAAYYPSKLSEEQREEAGSKLFQIPTGHGVFTILDSKVKAVTGQERPQSIEWLKFQVELNFTSSSGAIRAEGAANAPKSIRDIDIERFLKTRYTEVQPNLEHLAEECPEQGPPRISSVDIQYGDLDGDGQDEAVYQGFTCMSGTAGVDFFGVLKLQPGGKLVGLPIEAERKEFKGRSDIYKGVRGHLRLEIEKGRLLEVFPVYANEGECNACSSGGERDFVYRWDGHQFTLDDIIDVAPAESGN
jgi:hypothetical protein